MRMLMHHYAYSICVNIRSQLAIAMAPDSRSLICDMIVLRRVGDADPPAAVLDQAVMTMDGKERTASGFGALVETAVIELHTNGQYQESLVLV